MSRLRLPVDDYTEIIENHSDDQNVAVDGENSSVNEIGTASDLENGSNDEQILVSSQSRMDRLQGFMSSLMRPRNQEDRSHSSHHHSKKNKKDLTAEEVSDFENKICKHVIP